MRFRFVAIIGAIACMAASPVPAQNYPTKPVRIIVPFTAGSATDTLARTIGQKFTEFYGQPVVIDNRPGAGGTIGAAVVAKAAPDGYMLMVHSAAHAYNPSIYATLPFDTQRDFVDIAAIAGQPNLLVVARDSGLKTMADLIARAKKSPGSITYASAGTGSGTHINGEKFRIQAGIDVIHVPYKGTPEALTDVISGRVVYFFAPISAAAQYVKEGRLVALAVSTAKRSSVLPDVPTVAEAGLPGFDYNLWIGLFGPAGMPQDLVDRLNRDVAKVVQAPDVKERLATLGAEPMPMTPAEFHVFVAKEMDETGKVIKAAGIKAQ